MRRIRKVHYPQRIKAELDMERHHVNAVAIKPCGVQLLINTELQLAQFRDRGFSRAARRGQTERLEFGYWIPAIPDLRDDRKHFAIGIIINFEFVLDLAGSDDFP